MGVAILDQRPREEPLRPSYGGAGGSGKPNAVDTNTAIWSRPIGASGQNVVAVQPAVMPSRAASFTNGAKVLEQGTSVNRGTVQAGAATPFVVSTNTVIWALVTVLFGQ